MLMVLEPALVPEPDRARKAASAGTLRQAIPKNGWVTPVYGIEGEITIFECDCAALPAAKYRLRGPAVLNRNKGSAVTA